MNFIILFFIIIFMSILASVLIFKHEDKKDKLLKKRRNERIYKDYIYLLNQEKSKLEHQRNTKLEYQDYLNSDHWKEIRIEALNRAGHRCQLCSSTYNLNVHHNTYKNRGNEDLKDLVVLCRDCHAKFHDKLH